MRPLKNEAEIKVRVKRNPRGAFRKIILVIIMIYIAIITYGYIRDLVVTRLAKVEQVRHGVIQNTVEGSGILVRSEKVVSAPRTGILKVIIPEGERVRVGEVVAHVIVVSLDSKTGETLFNVIAPVSGIVSYHLDGLENIYSAKNIAELDLAKVETMTGESSQVLPGTQVEEGRPLLKIVNNLDPMYLIASASDLAISEKDIKKSFLISLNSGKKDEVKAVLVEQNFRGKPGRFLLSIANYDNRLAVPRNIDFTIVTERFEGYVLPTGAIVTKEDKDGIFTVYKERIKWKEVNVVGKSEGKIVISGVTPDIKVILNPEYVKEGRPFK